MVAEKAHVMAGSPTATCKEHHDLSLAVRAMQEENNARLRSVLRSFVNPMKYENEDLTNIITRIVMSAEVEKNVCKFVEERINTNEVRVWVRMKKVQLKTWKSAGKSVKHKMADQVVDLKDGRSLFTRILILAR